MTFAARKAALYLWLKTEARRITGNAEFKVIMENQAEQRPKPPYASLRVVNPSIRVGSVDESGMSGDLVQMRANRRAVASVHVIGLNACDILSSIRDTLDRPDVNDAFRAAGMSHESESGVRDLTPRLETTYEERAQMDIVLTYTNNETVDVSTIETVEVSGELDSGLNEIESVILSERP